MLNLNHNSSSTNDTSVKTTKVPVSLLKWDLHSVFERPCRPTFACSNGRPTQLLILSSLWWSKIFFSFTSFEQFTLPNQMPHQALLAVYRRQQCRHGVETCVASKVKQPFSMVATKSLSPLLVAISDLPQELVKRLRARILPAWPVQRWNQSIGH